MGAKEEYDSLLDSGELLEFHPELSGSWSKDKNKFTAIWEQNIDAINNVDLDFDEYD